MACILFFRYLQVDAKMFCSILFCAVLLYNFLVNYLFYCAFLHLLVGNGLPLSPEKALKYAVLFFHVVFCIVLCCVLFWHIQCLFKGQGYILFSQLVPEFLPVPQGYDTYV